MFLPRSRSTALLVPGTLTDQAPLPSSLTDQTCWAEDSFQSRTTTLEPAFRLSHWRAPPAWLEIR